MYVASYYCQTEVYAALSQQTYGNICISFISKQFTEIMVGWLWAKKATISRGNPDPSVEQDVSYTKMFGIVFSFWNCRHKLA